MTTFRGGEGTHFTASAPGAENPLTPLTLGDGTTGISIKIFGARKLELLGYHATVLRQYLNGDMFNLVMDIRTDTQTDALSWHLPL